MSSEKFCIRWNDFETNISVAFRELRDDKDFFDVTLACEDEQLQAHKVILSACSPFFRNVLRRNPHQHPLLYLKGVKYTDLQSVLNFMYHGEVNVAQEELNSFLAVAEELRVKGLTQNNQSAAAANRIKENYNSAPRSPSAPKVRPPERDPIPPPKRPRPTITTPTFPASQEDDDIQEVVPVKTEPREAAPAPPPQPPAQTYHHPSPAPVTPAASMEQPVVGQLQQMDDSLQQFQGDESYDDYGQYGAEGGYEDGTMGDPSMGHADAAKGFTHNLDEVTVQNSDKTTEGYQCKLCLKNSKDFYAARNHMESKHFASSEGYTCDYCSRSLGTRKAYTNHKSLCKRRVFLFDQK